jgi:tetratricopeptide (TPR) repeat protein
VLKKTADAIRIFELNVELYPASSNTYDSLGEAYMANGEKELAIKNYEKSLELNARNNNAVEMLKKLKAE